MKDVSKQTLEKLITFIYCGHVNLNESDLKDFFETAHALEIDGLTSDICLDYIDPSAPSDSERAIPAINGIQYQSTATVRCHGSDNGIQDHDQDQTIEFVYVDETEHDGTDQRQYFSIANGPSAPDSTQRKSISPKARKRYRFKSKQG